MCPKTPPIAQFRATYPTATTVVVGFHHVTLLIAPTRFSSNPQRTGVISDGLRFVAHSPISFPMVQPVSRRRRVEPGRPDGLPAAAKRESPGVAKPPWPVRRFCPTCPRPCPRHRGFWVPSLVVTFHKCFSSCPVPSCRVPVAVPWPSAFRSLRAPRPRSTAGPENVGPTSRFTALE